MSNDSSVDDAIARLIEGLSALSISRVKALRGDNIFEQFTNISEDEPAGVEYGSWKPGAGDSFKVLAQYTARPFDGRDWVDLEKLPIHTEEDSSEIWSHAKAALAYVNKQVTSPTDLDNLLNQRIKCVASSIKKSDQLHQDIRSAGTDGATSRLVEVVTALHRCGMSIDDLIRGFESYGETFYNTGHDDLANRILDHHRSGRPFDNQYLLRSLLATHEDMYAGHDDNLRVVSNVPGMSCICDDAVSHTV